MLFESHPATGARTAACLVVLAALFLASPLGAQQESAVLSTPEASDTEDTEELEQFRVELIVFEYGDSLAGTSEDWSAPVVETPEEEAEDADAAGVDGRDNDNGNGNGNRHGNGNRDGAGDVPDDTLQRGTGAERSDADAAEAPVFRFAPVPEDEWQLVELERRLRNTNGYEPLLHVAWQQPGYDPDASRPLDLARLAELPGRLQGEAHLYRSRFLHLALELELLSASPGRSAVTQRPPTALPSPAAGEPLPALAPDVFRLSERRKLRSGELHYYDHPRYGVLATVTPVEPAPDAGESGEDRSGDGGGGSDQPASTAGR